MNYSLNTLAEVIAQVAQFAVNDFAPDPIPQPEAECAGLIIACFVAQHTVMGAEGVGKSEACEALQTDRAMSYRNRILLAKKFIAAFGGEK